MELRKLGGDLAARGEGNAPLAARIAKGKCGGCKQMVYSDEPHVRLQVTLYISIADCKFTEGMY